MHINTVTPTRTSTSDKPDALKLATAALEDKKGLDIRTIKLNSNAPADYLLIATGTSERHVQTLADNVAGAFHAAGLEVLGQEGSPANQWVLVDAGHLVVHVFLPETRELYNLERLWGSPWHDDSDESDCVA